MYRTVEGSLHAKNQLDPFIRFDRTPTETQTQTLFNIASVKYNVTTLKIKDCSPHMNWIELVEQNSRVPVKNLGKISGILSCELTTKLRRT